MVIADANGTFGGLGAPAGELRAKRLANLAKRPALTEESIRAALAPGPKRKRAAAAGAPGEGRVLGLKRRDIAIGVFVFSMGALIWWGTRKGGKKF